MNRYFIFSSIAISLLFNVSMILRIEQYISFPLTLRNPPAIFWRFIPFAHIVIKRNLKIIQKHQMVLTILFHSVQKRLFLLFGVTVLRLHVLLSPLAD